MLRHITANLSLPVRAESTALEPDWKIIEQDACGQQQTSLGRTCTGKNRMEISNLVPKSLCRAQLLVTVLACSRYGATGLAAKLKRRALRPFLDRKQARNLYLTTPQLLPILPSDRFSRSRVRDLPFSLQLPKLRERNRFSRGSAWHYSDWSSETKRPISRGYAKLFESVSLGSLALTSACAYCTKSGLICRRSTKFLMMGRPWAQALSGPIVLLLRCSESCRASLLGWKHPLT